MTLVERIVESRNSKTDKLVALWAITQLRFRTTMGDEAWEAIQKITDKETTMAIAFLTGHAVGMGATISKERSPADQLRKLIPRNVIIVPGEV